MDNTTKAEFKVATREEAIEKYREWFKHAVNNNPLVAASIDKIREAHTDGRDINLVCYCKPAACHGDVIEEYLEHYFIGYDDERHELPSLL